MEAPASLGQWPNAPLALVLTQVRFEQFIDMDSQIAEFQKAVASDFPRTTQGGAMTLSLPQGMVSLPSKVTSIYQFTNAARTKNIRVDAGALTYTVSEYTDYENFAAEMKAIVLAFEAAMKRELFVTQLGMRYVDFIVPQLGRGIGDYVESPLCRMPALGSGSPSGMLSLAEFPYAEGALRFQCAAGYGPPSLPDELLPPHVELPKKTDARYDGPSGVLDFDRILKPDSKLSGEDILRKLAVMHTDLSEAFKKVTTTDAQKEWQAQE